MARAELLEIEALLQDDRLNDRRSVCASWRAAGVAKCRRFPAVAVSFQEILPYRQQTEQSRFASAALKDVEPEQESDGPGDVGATEAVIWNHRASGEGKSRHLNNLVGEASFRRCSQLVSFCTPCSKSGTFRECPRPLHPRERNSGLHRRAVVPLVIRRQLVFRNEIGRSEFVSRYWSDSCVLGSTVSSAGAVARTAASQNAKRCRELY
jgi:hypothetical protein